MSNAVRRFIALFAVLPFVTVPATAGEYGALNPKAPEQTAQYAFLIGEWDCETRFMQPDQSYVPGHATWTGRYILDGWAIQDVWISDRPDGTRFHGTNIRSFNPEKGKWDNRWLPQGNLNWAYFESEQVDETMVMTGGEGKDPRGAYVDRNVFYDIREDGWRWRKDRSYDGGETWFEGIGFITATRAGALSSVEADLLQRVEHGFVDNAGVKLHYATLGDGPLVVLLHGFPDYWYTWRHQMEALARDHRVVAIDLRGYNKSSHPVGVENYAMRLLVSDVVAVVRHFGAEKATIVGHDWGGGIAWMVASYVPDIVERLVVLSTPHPFNLRRELAENAEQQKNSEYAHKFQEAGAHESLTAEILAAYHEEAARPQYIEAFNRSSFEGMLAYYKANYPRVPSGGSPTPPPPAGKISCPVLVFHGLEDKALLPSGFNGTWEFVDAELTIVSLPGVGHWVQHEAAEQVTKMLTDWLAR